MKLIFKRKKRIFHKKSLFLRICIKHYLIWSFFLFVNAIMSSDLLDFLLSHNTNKQQESSNTRHTTTIPQTTSVNGNNARHTKFNTWLKQQQMAAEPRNQQKQLLGQVRLGTICALFLNVAEIAKVHSVSLKGKWVRLKVQRMSFEKPTIWYQ